MPRSKRKSFTIGQSGWCVRSEHAGSMCHELGAKLWIKGAGQQWIFLLCVTVSVQTAESVKLQLTSVKSEESTRSQRDAGKSSRQAAVFHLQHIDMVEGGRLSYGKIELDRKRV